MGVPHLSYTPPGGVPLHLPGPFAVRPPEVCGGCVTASPRVMSAMGDPSWGFWGFWPGAGQHWGSQCLSIIHWPLLGPPVGASPLIHLSMGRSGAQCVRESRSIYGNKTSFFLDQLLVALPSGREKGGVQEWEVPGAALQTSLSSVAIRPWFLSPPLLSSAQEEALLGGLWLVLSHQRGLRAVAAQSRPSWK